MPLAASCFDLHHRSQVDPVAGQQNASNAKEAHEPAIHDVEFEISRWRRRVTYDIVLLERLVLKPFLTVRTEKIVPLQAVTRARDLESGILIIEELQSHDMYCGMGQHPGQCLPGLESQAFSVASKLVERVNVLLVLLEQTRRTWLQVHPISEKRACSLRIPKGLISVPEALQDIPGIFSVCGQAISKLGVSERALAGDT